MDIIYHPYLFNPLYWHIRAALADPNIRFIFVQGGSSAAKTYSIVQAIMTDQLENNYNAMVYRKEGTTLDDTIYADFQTVGKQLEIDEVDYLRRMVREKSGRYHTSFKGLDDPEKAKGLSSYKLVYMNEISKFEKEDFEEIKRRLRGVKNQKIIADWNPIDHDHWMRKDVIDKEVDDIATEEWTDLPLDIASAPTKYCVLDPEYSSKKINTAGNTILIKTTYRDNYWVIGHPAGEKYGYVDQHTIDNFNDYKTRKDPYYWDVYALGNWGRIKLGGEFFDEFNRPTHVTFEDKAIRTDAVKLTFDFNRKPYSTCLVRQINQLPDGTIEYNLLDEICLKPPANTIEDIRDDLIYKHPWIKEVFYGGDPSGRAKGQRKAREESDSYEEMIEIAFSNYIHNRSNMFLRSHPPKARRKNAMADVLRGKVCKFTVSHKCVNTIKDFETLQVDTTGGYVKKKVKDASGAVYEEGGHCMDALIYDLAELFPDIFFS